MESQPSPTALPVSGTVKFLGALAIALGATALGIGLYHLIETYPNYTNERIGLRYSATMWNQVYAMWALGGLGVVLSVISIKRFKPAYLGLGLSIISLLISMSTEMTNRF